MTISSSPVEYVPIESGPARIWRLEMAAYREERARRLRRLLTAGFVLVAIVAAFVWPW